MQYFFIAVTIYAVYLVIIVIMWVRRYQSLYGFFAVICRALWLVPIVLFFFPIKQASSNIANKKDSMSDHIITVFLDDSSSMNKQTYKNKTLYQQGIDLVETLQDYCSNTFCAVELVLASTINQSFLQGFSPLTSSLKEFVRIYQSSSMIVISDGGNTDDIHRSISANLGVNFANNQVSFPSQTNKYIVGWNFDQDSPNISFGRFSLPKFSFVNQSTIINASVISKGAKLSANLRGQIRVMVNGELYASDSFVFNSDASTTELSIKLPRLKEGLNYIGLQLLPLAKEVELYDNYVGGSINTLAHSINTLHLIGSPSADGRFLRRLLKLDQRFELISFYILRDPWDTVSVEKDQLSLISFPVDKLFNQELEHFDLVIIQNFRLSEFLNSSYQENLVKYVKQGGSILFIGGPRAFHPADLAFSFLHKIIPFVYKSSFLGGFNVDAFSSSSLNTEKISNVPWYNNDLAFSLRVNNNKHQIKSNDQAVENDQQDIDKNTKQHSNKDLAKDSDGLISPASVLIDELWFLDKYFHTIEALYGMNDTQNLQFDNNNSITIIEALLEDQKANKRVSTPIVSASYLEKGRAIWIFTDALWQLALPQENYFFSRDLYNQMFLTLIRWLARDEKNPPLSVDRFDLNYLDQGNNNTSAQRQIEFSIHLSGMASDYLFEDQSELNIQICGGKVNNFQLRRQSDYSAMISGRLDLQFKDIESLLTGKKIKAYDQSSMLCELDLKLFHPSIGQEQLKDKQLISDHANDQIISYSWGYLNILKDKYQARLMDLTKNKVSLLAELIVNQIKKTIAKQQLENSLSLSNKSNQDNIFVSDQQLNPYHLFDHWWVVLLLLGIFFEVVFRKLGSLDS